MIIAWIVYGVLVSTLVALAARAVEWVGRRAGYPARWVWAGAIALTLVLVGRAPFAEGPGSVGVPLIASTQTSGRGTPASIGSWWSKDAQTGIGAARRGLDALVIAGVSQIRRLPKAAGTYVAAGWLALSIALVALLAAVEARFRRERRGWPATALQGERVRVAPDTGPAVIGLARPEIVVPQWLLARRDDEQRLVVTHEAEHVRARDPFVLGLACVAAAVVPWNPAMWFMLSRLRLAVELDCDARVLRRGATPLSYGALLIDVAENTSARRLRAVALADDSSHLHQRILAMKSITLRFPRLRASAAVAFGFVALLAACEAKLPTSAEVDAMDASSAEKILGKRALDSSIVYLVDGVRTPAAQAKAIDKADIESIEVAKKGLDGMSWIDIRTKGAPGSKRVQPANDSVAGKVVRRSSLSSSTFNGLVMIDGVRVDKTAIDKLSPDSIKAIEIVKGAAAANLYGADALNGAIIITTKQAKTP